MLCIKTGMKNEYDIARQFAAPGTLLLTGVQTVEDLEKRVPKECKAIMSFGMAGGLRPRLPIVGQTVVASYLLGPKGEHYVCDPSWRHRIFDKTRFYVQPYYSSGKFNEANTPAQRRDLYEATGAWCIDDESLWVAQFAQARGIPFAIVRNVSDQWNDDVSITSTLLNKNGGVDPWGVIKAIFTDPIDMETITYHFEVSQHALTETAKKLAPTFGYIENPLH